MSLEATMILVDNSDYSRNGDYVPTRWEVQKDSVSIIANKKMQTHPDNAVGLITLARNQVEVLCTPCQDPSILIASLHDVLLGGQIHFSNGLQIAQLALKHRQNKAQRQRIVVFVASPVHEDEQKLIMLAKKLKRNNVAVDIINMGQNDQEQIQKLEKFIETVNSSDNSHFLNIHSGINPSDQLYGTAIMGGQEGGQAGFGQQGGFDHDLGFDPNMEPELAMALRISLEEEKRRQEQSRQQQEGGQGGQAQNQEQNQMQIEQEVNFNEQNIQQQQQQQQQQVQQLQGDEFIEDELEQDELLRRAMELSLQDVPQNQQQQQQAQQNQKIEDKHVLQDAEFLDQLLDMIPEINKEDEEIKKALEELKKNNDKNDQSKQ